MRRSDCRGFRLPGRCPAFKRQRDSSLSGRSDCFGLTAPKHGDSSPGYTLGLSCPGFRFYSFFEGFPLYPAGHANGQTPSFIRRIRFYGIPSLRYGQPEPSLKTRRERASPFLTYAFLLFTPGISVGIRRTRQRLQCIIRHPLNRPFSGCTQTIGDLSQAAVKTSTDSRTHIHGPGWASV